MRLSFRYLILAGALVVTACGSSKGPGDIGSKNDIFVRNAGDPEPAAMAKAEPAQEVEAEAEMDPVMAEHAQAVEDAKPEIDEMAAADPDDTPVPGDPVEQPEEESVAVEMETEEDVSAEAEMEEEAPAPAIKAEKVSVKEAPAEVDTAKSLIDAEARPMAQAQPEAETSAVVNVEPVTETATAPVAAKAATTAAVANPNLPKPVLEGDPAVSDEMMEEEATAEPAATPVTTTQKAAPAPLDPVVETAQASPAPSGTKTGLITNPSQNLIKALQVSLKEKGYYFGAADGELGAETLNALHLYQNAHGMSDYGMTYETLSKLGVDASAY